MPDKKFLEEYPLYKKYEMDVSPTIGKIPKPKINMFCEVCDSEQTFIMNNDYWDDMNRLNIPVDNLCDLTRYLCVGCDTFHRYFLIKISRNLDSIMKVGQYPPRDISMDKNTEKSLKDHAAIFKKGLICESQGYGIGAYAYYRRIVELIIDELLDSISDLIVDEDKTKYQKALDDTKSVNNAQQKIELVKDLLPPILRPNGMNPLSVLHNNLSCGLHKENDEECLRLAEEVRGVLIFLINQTIRSKESSKTFTDGMKKLLDKKAK